MYNTNFNVKYYDIEQELLAKKEYLDDDIQCICQKLYVDELSSVFYADNITDDKIDKGIEYIFTKITNNINFLNIVNYTKDLLLLKENENSDTYIYNSNYIIILASFSFPVFHIMHQCIVQQLTTNSICEDLLVKLQTNLENYILSKR